MKFKSLFIVLVTVFSTFSYGQGPEPCPCDPTEGEIAYEACLAANPQCDEEIPIDSQAYVLGCVGLLYAVYLGRKGKVFTA